MQGERIVLDGLWRCLCPSIDAAALSKVLQRPGSSVPRSQPATTQRRSVTTGAHITRARPSNSNRPVAQRIWKPVFKEPSEQGQRSSRKGGSQWAPTFAASSDASEHDRMRYVARRWKRRPKLPPAFFDGPRFPNGQNFPDEALDQVETEEIIEGLRELTTEQEQYHGICNAVRYLVTRRNRKPDAFLYECLIKANADPHHGSARVVANLLEEMDAQGILPTLAIFHSVLDVLAVHPDYVLRNKTIDKMKAIWNPPSFNGHVAIAVGLLRDGQLEMAFEKLEELHKTGVPIPTWLYDVFIFSLGEIGVHEETLMVMQHRLRQPTASMPHNVWQFVLESFSRDGFYEGIRYLWNRVVTLGKLAPSDGVAINVLNAASRNGDATMTMQVLKYLSDRGSRLGMHHFEALLEIQARDNDLRRAFSTMCLMAKAGLQPDRSSTRTIWLQLRGSPEQTDEALAILHDLRKNNNVPIAAFNVVLEATLFHRNFKAALDLYRTVHQVCSGGPSLETYSILLEKCTLHKSMRFLLAEMEQFSIELDESIYDRIIFISTLNSNYEPAFRYLDKMGVSKTDGLSNNWWISRRTALALLRRSILAEDIRTEGIIAACKKRNLITDADIDVLIRAVQKKRQAKQEKLIADEARTTTVQSVLEPGMTQLTTESITPSV